MRFVFVLGVIFLYSLPTGGVLSAAPTDQQMQALTAKLDQAAQNYEKISQALAETRKELDVIKIRLTRKIKKRPPS